MIILMVLSSIIIIFGLVILVGAPYLPTLRQQTESALVLLDLKKGQTLIDLGSGDGRVLKFAAKRGIKSIGYEINPLLVIISKINTFHQRDKVTIHWSNYWKEPLPPAEGIFVFLIENRMQKLEKLVSNYRHKPIKLVSFAFKIPNKKPSKKMNGIYLYKYR